MAKNREKKPERQESYLSILDDREIKAVEESCLRIVEDLEKTKEE